MTSTETHRGGLDLAERLASRSMRILIVEDEPAIADFVERGAARRGPRRRGRLRRARRRAPRARVRRSTSSSSTACSPGSDGLAVLRAVRERQAGAARDRAHRAAARSPTASRASTRAPTDYLVKPFAFERARRARARAPAHARPVAGHGAFGRGHRDGPAVARGHPRRHARSHLSAKEFDLLAHFLRHPNQVLSREQLLSAVWGYDFDPQTNIVEVYVGYLRRKLSTPERPAPDRHAALRGLPPDGPVR